MRLSSSSAQTAASAKIEIKPPALNGVLGTGGTDTTYGTNGEIPGGTPESGLSDYIFTLESSGGGAYSDPNVYTDKSNVWVTNHTNVASGSTPTFSWTPDVADIDDFYSANEMLINGNDIYIIYRWGSYNKNNLGNDAWNQYLKNTIDPDTGEPFGEWPLRDGNPGPSITDLYDPVTGLAHIYGTGYLTSSHILVKFTNCVVDEVAQDITYDSFEKKILYGVQHLHGNARTSDKWILSERTETWGKPASSYGVDQMIVVVDLNKPISETKIFNYSNLFKDAVGTRIIGTTIPMFDHVTRRAFLLSSTPTDVKRSLITRNEHGVLNPIIDSSDQITATGSYVYIMGYDANFPDWANQITPSGYFNTIDSLIWYNNAKNGQPFKNVTIPEEYIDFYTSEYNGWSRALLRVNLDSGQVETVHHTLHKKGSGLVHPFSYDKYIFTITMDLGGIMIHRYDLESGSLTVKFLCVYESGHYKNDQFVTFNESVDLVSMLNNISVSNISVSADNVYSTLSPIFGIISDTRSATDDFPDGNRANISSLKPHSAGTDGEFIYVHFTSIPQVMKFNYSDLSFHSYTDTGATGSPTDDYVQIGDYIFVGNETTTPYSLNYYHKDNITSDNGQITTMTHGPFGVFHSDFKF